MRSVAVIAWLWIGLLSCTAVFASEDDGPEERIRVAAAELLDERFPDMAARLGVRVVRVNGSPSADGTLHVRFARLDGVPRGHTQIHFRSIRDDGQHANGTALLYVSHYDSLAVAVRDVARGDEISFHDIDLAWIDLTAFRGQPLEREIVDVLEAGTTMIANRPVAAGDALRTGDVRAPYVADTGDRVMLRYRRGSIALTLSCQARQPGAADDVIRVYSDATRATYKARLHPDGSAEWVATL